MRRYGLGKERQDLREYLAAYGQTAQIKVVDLTAISTFNGRADGLTTCTSIAATPTG